MDSSHTAPPSAGPHPLGASLRRSSTDRLVLGLCGGVARALDVSPTAVRLATLLLGITLLPATVLAYLVTAVILPADDGTVLVGRGERRRRDVTAALLLTFVGAPLVIGAGAAWGLTSGPLVWPMLLLGAGAAIGIALYRPSTTAAAAPQPVAASPVPADAPMPSADHAIHDDAATDPAPAPGDTAITAVQSTIPEPVPPAAAAATAPTFVKHHVAAPAPSDPGGGEYPQAAASRGGLTLPVLSVMALVPAVFAVLFAAGVIEGGWSTWAVMLAVLALASAGGAVAIALLRPSYLGPALLVIMAATLGTASIALAQVGPLLDDGVGERTYRPQSTDEIQPLYVHGVGALDLDLRDVQLRRGSRTPLRVQLGLGELTVAVPRGVRVVAAPGSSLDGLTTSARRNGASAATSASAPTIVLDVALRAGDVRLVSGNAANFDNLEVLAQKTTGFWDPDGTDRFDRFRDLPPTPVTPPEPSRP